MFDHTSNQPAKKFVPPAKIHIAIIGLGYVGLPLAVEFAKKFPVKGFDIKQSRVDELNNAFDRTLETESEKLKAVLTTNDKADKGLIFTSTVQHISACNVYIISVPTPTDQYNRPDLSLLIKASQSVAGVLKAGDVVIYESTVYPGATEDVCVPVLEQVSGLKFNDGFFAG